MSTCPFLRTGPLCAGLRNAAVPQDLSTRRRDSHRVRSEQIMKIGIIGAGHIGGTLTRRLRALGNDVHVANSRGPESLQALASETGAIAVEVRDAPKDA